jgi:hypothetical protein
MQRPDGESHHLDLDLREAAGATISACGQYRYDLWREWNVSQPKLAFVMLNPSTADALRNDQTIEACIRFAKRDGYGGIVVRNLFAYRTPKPSVLAKAHKAGVDVVGEENDEWLAGLKSNRDIAAWVIAWGQGSGIPRALIEWRIEDVFDILGRLPSLALHPDPYRGQSPHPLYLKNDTPIAPWPARRPKEAADFGSQGGSDAAS